MTGKELSDTLNRMRNESDRAKDDIVRFSRSLVYVLQDKQAAATSEELKRLLFVLDAIEAEQQKMVLENSEAIMQLLLQGPGPPR